MIMVETKLYHGDSREILKSIPDASVDCCVTSPPYYFQRDYGDPDQIGMERSVDGYLFELVDVFSEVYRILKPTGTLWLNLGDKYAETKFKSNRKPKNLLGLPWRVAFAMQDIGFYLRSDIVWYKPNPLPESIKDRPTRSHEYIFLLSKEPKYYYDYTSIMEPAVSKKGKWTDHGSEKQRGHSRRHAGFNARYADKIAREGAPTVRNSRDVWTIAPAQFREEHYAVFPDELARRCILAGCMEGGTVLDPFAGAGTVMKVARDNGRNSIGIEISEHNMAIANKRLWPKGVEDTTCAGVM